MNYNDFLSQKKLRAIPAGFEVKNIPDIAFPFQKDIIRWAVKRGKAAIFADTGLGKTICELVWANEIVNETKENSIIFAPMSVAPQTVEIGKRLLDININLCEDQSDVKKGINIINYDRMHLLNSQDFYSIVLDESSILKAFEGTTRKELNQFSAHMPYRLACTATPAPNDLLEITNHSEFLGIMSGKEIIALYFTQDGNTTQHWRLKGHAKEDFWKWLASWAVAIRKPSDLGYSDDGFILPGLNVHLITVDSPECTDTLFPMDAVGLKEHRQARKDSLPARMEACKNLVEQDPDNNWIIWCDLNLESEALKKTIPNSTEVKGSDTREYKQQTVVDFVQGKVKRLISKSTIFGMGMNWQHCHKMIFAGLGFSFEQFYQAVRRCYRFGQKKVVDVYIVVSERELPAYYAIKAKEEEANKMFDQLVKNLEVHNNIKQAVKDEMVYNPQEKLIVPTWLVSRY